MSHVKVFEHELGVIIRSNAFDNGSVLGLNIVYKRFYKREGFIFELH